MQNFGQSRIRCSDRPSTPPNRHAGSLPQDIKDMVVYVI